MMEGTSRRRSAPGILLAAFAALAACSTAVAIVSAAAPATALAGTTTSTEPVTEADTDVLELLFDPCPGGAGVPVTITGHQHVTIHDSVDSASGVHFFALDILFSGTGTAPDPLNPTHTITWVFDDHQSVSSSVPGPPNTSTTTTDLTYHAYRQGETILPDDFLMHEIIHSTVSNAGLLVVTFDKGPATCV
jgi:hypothetical protein